MDQEPSVLDYVKSRLRYWRKKILHPSAVVEEDNDIAFLAEEIVEPVAERQLAESLIRIPWSVLLTMGLGLLAQLSLEPHVGARRSWELGFSLYVLAGLILIWANVRNEFSLRAWNDNDQPEAQNGKFLYSSVAFILSLVYALLAFIMFGGNRFTTLNLIVWLVALVTMVRAFQLPGTNWLKWINMGRDFLLRPTWSVSLNRSALPLLAVTLLVLFFRIYDLAGVPLHMISDHAEKLWDVGDVLNGQTAIFFQRNTGREFFQFYLTAAIALLFDTGLTYMSLKIGTMLAGLVAVLYIYLLGKEIGGARVGLLAMAFAGIAYWPNIISRYGLRFPLYPLFYAPALYYLARGLQRRNRNDFIISGLILGLGLHGYSPFRVVPILVVVAVGLYLLHQQSKGYRQQAIWGLFAVAIVSFVVFLPLLRYMTENPDMVFYRAMTRIGDWERPLPADSWDVFKMNFRNSMTMFGWDDGEVWPISITHRPALDVVTSALFHLGVLSLIIRYIRQRHWFDIFTLLSIPILMMPSILSLSFPGENPSLNRSAAAIVPVFLIVGLAADSLITALESAWSKRVAWTVGILLLAWASWQNYDLVFNQYRSMYNANSWNTEEMGQLVRNFSELTGSSDTAWLVGYPHWVDSRLVMINAGFPMRDNAIWPESFEATLHDPRPKLFLININDTADIELLQSLYPNGWLKEYKSKFEGRNFMIFFVPASGDIQ